MPPFALPHASAALQGPLNAGTASAELGAGRAVALCALHHLVPEASTGAAGSMRMQVRVVVRPVLAALAQQQLLAAFRALCLAQHKQCLVQYEHVFGSV